MGNEKNNLPEFANSGEEKVARLLGGLKRVEAPGNFDMRVRARIAQGRPTHAGTRWFPVFARVAAPALLLVAVGGYFGYDSLYREGNTEVPQVAVTAPTLPNTTEPAGVNVPAPVPSAEVAAAKPAVNSNDLVAAAPKKESASANKKPEQPGGGSLDSALREANSIILRNDAEQTGNTSAPSPAPKLSVREVFSAMGIRASHSGEGWRVSSAGGAAAAAGLLTGDIIESVNGQPVGANTVFDPKFVGRTLSVSRGGARVTISF